MAENKGKTSGSEISAKISAVIHEENSIRE